MSDSEGPNSPATVANDTSYGTLSWTNPSNATSSNNADATVYTESGTTRYLKATDFGFSIPDGATIDGIVVEIEKSSQEGCSDSRVRIVKGGTIGSEDKSIIGNWPSSDTYKTHGLLQTDDWGESWAASDINASDFGVAISALMGGDPAAAFVDHIRITVYYEEAVGGLTAPFAAYHYFHNQADKMFFIRQNATHKVTVGPVVAVGDGFTPITNLSVSTADEAEAILHNNGTVVDVSGYTFAAITTADGYYHLTLQSGITSTVGHVTVAINDDSLCLPVKADFTVVEESVYDNLYAASAVGPLTAAQVNSEVDTGLSDYDGPTNAEMVARTLVAASYFDPAADTVATVTTLTNLPSITSDWLTAAGLAADAATEIRNAVTGGAYALDTDSNGRIRIVDGTGAGELNTSSGLVQLLAATQASIDAIETDTSTTLEAHLTDIKGTGFVKDTHSLIDIETFVDILDDGTSGNAKIATDVAAVLVDTGTTLDTKLNNIQGGTFSSSTDSLEAIRNRGDAEWTTGAGGSDRLLMVDTTIATLASQTSFTLTAGSTDDDAYLNCTAVIEDASTATQKAIGLISAYTGSSKTVTLKYDPDVFTMAATDKIYVLAENALKSTAQNRQLDVTATGEAGLDLDNVAGALGTAAFDSGFLTASLIATDAIGAAELAADAVTEIRNAVTGGAYALDTDSNGRLRIVDGTGAGELDLSNGLVQLLAATQASIDAIEADTNALQQDWVNGGRLDLIIDAILVDTGTTLEGKIDTIDGIVDDILVDTGTTLEGKIDTIDGIVDAILVDTGTTLNSHLTDIKGTGFVKDTHSLIDIETYVDILDDGTSGNVKIATDTAAVLVDTGTSGVVLANDAITAAKIATNAIGADELAADAVTELRDAVTGGAYSLDTDANGRVRIVDGTGAGELDTVSGLIAGIAGTNNTFDDLNDITVANVLTTQMTEAYAANGVAPTLAQAIFAIHQKLMQGAYATTSSNVYKLDNATVAFVGTLDDATSPTADRRA